MSLLSWLQSLRSALAADRGHRHHRRRGSHRAATHRPSVELLEDRCVPASSVWADFNGDAFLDLATANYLSNDVSIFLDSGDGTLQPAQNYATYADRGPTCIAAGDFNGDGNLDLVTGNADASISLLLGNGDGSFWVNRYLSNMNAPQALAVGDFNGDGYLDVAVSGSDTEYWYAGVDVILGFGNGFVHSFFIPIAGGYAPDIAAADFNRDGNADLAWTAVTAIEVALSNGDGTFQPAQNYPLDFYAWSVEVADVNGDGNLDLVAYNESIGNVLLGNGDGTFQDASPPSLRINDVTVVEGNTGTVAATFLVTLSNASTETVTVAYATADSGATAGSDYQAASGMLTFAPGETSKTVTVLVNGDRLVEPTEWFVVNLSDPTNAFIAGDGGFCTIFDDEPRISITDAAVGEGNTGTRSATFTVTLSSASEVDVTVHYDTVQFDAMVGSDYTAASGDVVIPAGQTSATVTIAVMGDRLVEANETFAVNLSAATNAMIGDGWGAGTILDDEPRISVTDVTKREGRKNTTSFVFTVTLSAAYDEPVTVSFQTVNGTATTSDGDYVAKTGTLAFAPGETSKTITIEVKGDSKKEIDEWFSLDLFGNSSNSLFTKSRGIGTILNDD